MTPRCPQCHNRMSPAGLWPEHIDPPTYMAYTYICTICPKSKYNGYITLRIPTNRLAEIVR